MFCRQCGAPITEKSKFCRSCGAQVGDISKYCRYCGAPLSDKSKFCRGCGNPVDPTASPEPAQSAPTPVVEPTPVETAPAPPTPVAEPQPVALTPVEPVVTTPVVPATPPAPAQPTTSTPDEPAVRLSAKTVLKEKPTTDVAIQSQPSKTKKEKKPQKTILAIAIALSVLIILLIPSYLFLFKNTTGTKQEHTVHTFSKTNIIRQANCVEDGISAQTCDECDVKQLKTTPALGHTFGEWKVDREATCAKAGQKSITCTVCQYRQTEAIAQLKHAYTTKFEIVVQDDKETELIQYTCTHCEDTFKLPKNTETDIYSSTFVADCEENYSFRVYCEKDESYIRKHLNIYDAYFLNSDKQVKIDYTVEEDRNSYWTISPTKAYTGGDIYVASRTGAVLFEDMTVQDMTFQIDRETTEQISLTEGVKFIQAMEDAHAGYYPYTLDFSESSETYQLYLNKIDNLAVGDLICVGDARTIEDVVKQTGDPDVFGKIKYIHHNSANQTYLVELTAPDLNELFDVLDIYSTDGMLTGNIEYVGDEQIATQSMQLLYQSEDFAKLMCSVQDTSITYLAARGYTTNLTTIQDFFKKIKLNLKKSQKPTISEDGVIHGKFVLAGEISIPITLDSDPDSEQLGDIRFFFEAGVSLDSMKIILNLNKQTVKIEEQEEIVKAQIGSKQQITLSFTLGAEVNMDWSPTSKPYVLNTKSKKVHYSTCKHLKSVKDSKELEKLTEKTFFERIANENFKQDNECKTCLPISTLLSDGYILNTDTKVVHIFACKHAKQIQSSKMQIAEIPFGNILAAGYSSCEDCVPENRTRSSFADQVLKTMKSKDLSENLETFKSLAKKTGDSDGGSELTIAKIPFTITGLDAIELNVMVYFDFHLEATLEYNYNLQINSFYGIYVTETGYNPYSDFSKKEIRNDITLVGKTRVDLGLQAGINIHLIGLDKYCFADLTARAGLYAELHGALQHNFRYNTPTYAAAYFEAGVHTDLIGNIRLVNWKESANFIPEKFRDIPFMRYGYEKVYSRFVDTPSEIKVDAIYYNLEKSNLFNVKYLNLTTLKEGTDTLSALGIQDKYKVEYKLKDGSHCRISDGYLFVLDPEISFTDELTIVVTGGDEWGTYRPGNTQYNLESSAIVIRYDPKDQKTNIPEEAVELNHHRYYLYSLPAGTSYDEALAHCKNVGGYACTITSEEESEFVERYLKKQGEKSEIFFGLQYNTQAAKWTWNNGESFAYTDWVESADPTIYAALSIIDGQYVWEYTYQNTTSGGEMLILCEWGAYSNKADMTPEELMDEAVGHYAGWYTASQGITYGSISVYRTNALLKNEKLLKMYADQATKFSQNDQSKEPQKFTVKDIREIINKHEDEYIAIFTFGPLSVNPKVEEGLYTMKISYDETKGTYSFVGSEWIQHDTYVFADFKNISLQGSYAYGDTYGPYGFFGSYERCGEMAMEETELDTSN